MEIVRRLPYIQTLIFNTSADDMLEDRIIFLNGDFVPWSQATVHMMCHSFGRGSAIFEVLSFHETNAGPAVFRLDEHINRLFRTAQLLDMELPLSREEFQEAVLGTVKRNGLKKGFIKIIGFYPQIAFEILPPQKRLDVSIFVRDPAQDPGGRECPFERGTAACRGLNVRMVIMAFPKPNHPVG